MIVVVLVYWLTSTAYVIHHQYKNGERAFGVVLAALLLGPILVFIIRDQEKETEEQTIARHIYSEDCERRNNIPDFRIPTPPPITQIKQKQKDFKFFRGC